MKRIMNWLCTHNVHIWKRCGIDARGNNVYVCRNENCKVMGV